MPRRAIPCSFGLRIYNQCEKVRDQFWVYINLLKALLKEILHKWCTGSDLKYYNQDASSALIGPVDKAPFNEFDQWSRRERKILRYVLWFLCKIREPPNIYATSTCRKMTKINESYRGSLTLRYDFDLFSQYIHAGRRVVFQAGILDLEEHIHEFSCLEYWRTRNKPYIIQKILFRKSPWIV